MSVLVTQIPAGVMLTEVPPADFLYSVRPSRSFPGAFALLGGGVLTGSLDLAWLVGHAEILASMDRRTGLDSDVVIDPRCRRAA